MKKVFRSLISLLLVVLIAVPAMSATIFADTSVRGTGKHVNIAHTDADGFFDDSGYAVLTPDNKYISFDYSVDGRTGYNTSSGIFPDALCNISDGETVTISGRSMKYIDGKLTARLSGTGDDGMGSYNYASIIITNRSTNYDIEFSYYFENGEFHTAMYDQDAYDDITKDEDKLTYVNTHSTNCEINEKTSSVIVQHGETATLALTTPYFMSRHIDFVIFNIKTVHRRFGASGSGVPAFFIEPTDEGAIYYGDDEVAAPEDAEDEYADYEGKCPVLTDFATGAELYAVPFDSNKDFFGFYYLRDDNKVFVPSGVYHPCGNDLLYALFVDKGTPVFGVEDMIFTDLNEACSAALSSESKRVVVMNDGVLPAGDYFVPAGVTLLVPFDEVKSLYRDDPVSIRDGKVSTRTPFRRLDLASGANLVVNGELSVSAKHPANNTSPRGAVGKDFGWLYLNAGSSVTVNSGAKLYAWGFVTGDGLITAKSGSEVYELFQMTDFRGGNATLAMISLRNPSQNQYHNQFIINQYYVQNIESRLRIEAGAYEKVQAELLAGGALPSFIVNFIGPETDNADDKSMFMLGEGAYLEKYYDAAHDKMEYTLGGGAAEIGSLKLSLSVYAIDSSEYLLPINNIDFTITDGAEMSTSNDIVFLPGSSVTVDEGSSLTVNNGGSIVMAAKDDVSDYSRNNKPPCYPVIYSPSTNANNTRKWANTEESFINNNGTITVEEGGTLASTSPEAAMYSSDGEGAFVINGELSDHATLDVVTTSGTAVTDSGRNKVDAPPATIQDDITDGNYDDAHSIGAVWGVPTIIRKNAAGVWGDFRNVYWVKADGDDPFQLTGHEVMSRDEFDAMGIDDLPEPNARIINQTDDGHDEYIGWKVKSIDGQTIYLEPEYKHISYIFHIVWMNYNGKEFFSEEYVYLGQTVDAPVDDAIDEVDVMNGEDFENEYEFIGWNTLPNSTEALFCDDMPTAVEDVTYYAVYSVKDRIFKLKFQHKKPVGTGNVVEEREYKYNDTRYAIDPNPTLFEQNGYTFFRGWNTNSSGNKAWYMPGDILPGPASTSETKSYYGLYSTTGYTAMFVDPSGNTLYEIKLAVEATARYNHSIYNGAPTYKDAQGVEYQIVSWTSNLSGDTFDYGAVITDTPEAGDVVTYIANVERVPYQFTKHSITLNGTIGVNFYFNIYPAANGEKIRLTHGMDVASYDVDESIWNSDEEAYVASLALNSVDMLEDVTAEIISNDEDTIYATDEFSISDYFAAFNRSSEPTGIYLVGVILGENLWPSVAGTQERYEMQQALDGVGQPVTNNFVIENVELKAGDELKGYRTSDEAYFGDSYSGNYGNNIHISEDGVYKITCDSSFISITKQTTRETNLVPLLRAMAVYGDAAEDYFVGEAIEKSVDRIGGAPDYPELTPESAAALIDPLLENGSENTKTADLSDYGLEYYGTSLILDSGTTIRHYYKVNNRTKFNAVAESITFGGEAVTAKEYNLVYIYFDYDVPAAQMCSRISLKIGSAEVKFSVLDYVKRYLTKLDDPSTSASTLAEITAPKYKKLMTSLYWYYIYADRYFSLPA